MTEYKDLKDYKDLQNQLTVWLESLRSIVENIDKVKFDADLRKKCESIIPDDPLLQLTIAISNPKTRVLNLVELETNDIVDAVRANIHKELVDFGWDWLSQEEACSWLGLRDLVKTASI
jgi:hypothetical protein